MLEFQNKIERIYFGNDVKGGVSNLLGEPANLEEGTYPNEIYLPQAIQQPVLHLLELSTYNEMSARFYYENGKWVIDNIQKGPAFEIIVRDDGITFIASGESDSLIKRRLRTIFGRVPVINFHTHPTKAVQELFLPRVEREYPFITEDEIKRIALQSEVDKFLPSAQDIFFARANIRNGIVFLVASSGGFVLLMRKDIKVPLFMSKDDAVIADDAFIELGTNVYDIFLSYQDVAQLYQDSRIKSFEKAAEKAGFIVYYSFNPRDNILKRLTANRV